MLTSLLIIFCSLPSQLFRLFNETRKAFISRPSLWARWSWKRTNERGLGTLKIGRQCGREMPSFPNKVENQGEKICFCHTFLQPQSNFLALSPHLKRGREGTVETAELGLLPPPLWQLESAWSDIKRGCSLTPPSPWGLLDSDSWHKARLALRIKSRISNGIREQEGGRVQ